MSAFDLAIMLIVLASIQLWIFAAIRLWNGQSLLVREPRPEIPWGLSDILMAIVFLTLDHGLAHEWFCMSHGVSGPLKLHELGLEISLTYVGLMACASLVALAQTLAWLVLRHRASASELGIQVRAIGLDVRLGLRAFVMLAPIVYVIQAILVQFVKSEHPLIEMLKKNPSSRFFALSGFAAVIVAPLVEEYFFRVLLQGWFERLAIGGDSSWRIFFGGRKPSDRTNADAPAADPTSMNVEASGNQIAALPESEKALDVASRIPRWPIVVSAALFAASHASNGPDPVPLFVLALGLGYLYQTTRRILPSIIVHFLLNGATLLMMWLFMQEGK
jgi:membrane protease YdiL (CAAX protease family)